MVNTNRRRPTPAWMKLLLIGAGIAFGLLLAMLLLAVFPALNPNKPAYERQNAGTSVTVQYKVSDGDLFAWLPGKIQPPKDDHVLAEFTMAWDADGFRLPLHPADQYPIIAFGDSFTEGTTVAVPWPDILAERLNVPVRNYGYRGYGPLEIQTAAQEVAGKERRTWLLYAFFAGNDVSEANRTELIETRSPFYLIPHLAQQAAENVATSLPQATPEHYDYPMPVIIGGSYYEMAFLPYYMWWEAAPPEGFEVSVTFQRISAALDTMATSVSPETCRALIYVPTKEQLYYPYIHPGARMWIRSSAQATYIADNGELKLRDAPFDEAQEAAFLSRLGDLRDALRQAAEAKGWHFIDLLPAFQEHVAQAEVLYYPYDTHWNADGHVLAAQIIAAALQNIPGCPLQ